MAVGDTPLYTPAPPTVQLTSPDGINLSNWMMRELTNISNALLNIPRLQMTPVSAAPTTPREGLLAFADGTNWNPDNLGRGLVVYNGVNWESVGGVLRPPGGRLSLISGQPSPNITTTTGATTVFYTPYISRWVPIWNGFTFVMMDVGGELSQATTDTTKSPAAVVAASNYDFFVWNDGGTFRCTRGPLWTSATARGTGAGTTQLSRVQGIFTNANAISNGPAAGFGTYVGTVRSDAAAATISVNYGGSASGGVAALLNVWNMYNRLNVLGLSVDNGANYNYTSATVRRARAAAGNSISWVDGAGEEVAIADLWHEVLFPATAGAGFNAGVGVNSTTAFFLPPAGVFAQNQSTNTPAFDIVSPSIPIQALLGFNTLNSLEQGDGTNAVTTTHSQLSLYHRM